MLLQVPACWLERAQVLVGSQEVVRLSVTGIRNSAALVPVCTQRHGMLYGAAAGSCSCKAACRGWQRPIGPEKAHAAGTHALDDVHFAPSAPSPSRPPPGGPTPGGTRVSCSAKLEDHFTDLYGAADIYGGWPTPAVYASVYKCMCPQGVGSGRRRGRSQLQSRYRRPYQGVRMLPVVPRPAVVWGHGQCWSEERGRGVGEAAAVTCKGLPDLRSPLTSTRHIRPRIHMCARMCTASKPHPSCPSHPTEPPVTLSMHTRPTLPPPFGTQGCSS